MEGRAPNASGYPSSSSSVASFGRRNDVHHNSDGVSVGGSVDEQRHPRHEAYGHPHPYSGGNANNHHRRRHSGGPYNLSSNHYGAPPPHHRQSHSSHQYTQHATAPMSNRPLHHAPQHLPPPQQQLPPPTQQQRYPPPSHHQLPPSSSSLSLYPPPNQQSQAPYHPHQPSGQHQHHHPHHHPVALIHHNPHSLPHPLQQQQQQQQPHHTTHPHPPQNRSLPDARPPPPRTYVTNAPIVNLRPSRDRPLVKITLNLIETYKHINRIYYEEKDRAQRRRREQQQKQQQQQQQQQQDQQSQQQQQQQSPERRQPTAAAANTLNNGWDDEHYDYIITNGELLADRYIVKERIGKGSFGQVVRAVDNVTDQEVAVKIIKSKKPFLMQAKTEIDLLLSLTDRADQHNIVKLITHFMFRNHQCLVFEMLSLNLYELLKNTQFCGVSLNLIRKFAKQILKSLSFLSRPQVDIIHCDLKPENILLRHPKRSGVKVIDFGSSCRSNRRMYSYIQSRFYRSPEVMLGLPYTVAIDVWSLGCILVEMHTGEPLFSGADQYDQMRRIVDVLGPIPDDMIERSDEQHRSQFFERVEKHDGDEKRTSSWVLRTRNHDGDDKEGRNNNNNGEATTDGDKDHARSTSPRAALAAVVGCGTERRKKYPTEGLGGSEAGRNGPDRDDFIDLVLRMLAYDPRKRIVPEEALRHAFVAGSVTATTTTNTNKTRRSPSSEQRV